MNNNHRGFNPMQNEECKLRIANSCQHLALGLLANSLTDQPTNFNVTLERSDWLRCESKKRRYNG